MKRFLIFSFVLLLFYNYIIKSQTSLLINSLLLIASFFIVFYLLYDFIKIENKKNIKNIADVVFLTILAVAICIPCIRINKEDYNNLEKRPNAAIPNLYDRDKNFNNFYGKDWEEYFKDRFFIRNKLLRAYYYTIGDLNNVIFAGRVSYNKTYKRMFLHYQHYNVDYNRYYLIEEVADNFNKLNNFCQEHGIKLYILIVPEQEDLTEETYPYYLKKYKQTKKDFIKLLQQKTTAPLVFPLDELLEESKKNPVSFRTDIHWTENGAFVGYKAVMNVIKKDYPDIKILQDDDFNIVKNKKVRCDWDRNFTNGMLVEETFPYCKNCSKKLLNDDYLYYNFKKQNLLKTTVTDIPYLKKKEFYYPDGADYKVLMIGTSVNESLTQFIPYTFKNVEYIRLNNIKNVDYKEGFKMMKYHEKQILNYKPDIMIFSIIQGNVFMMHKLFLYD